ncbi:MAG TPA: helix-turn-helix domain-containing protein [Chitinophaga sp.]
MKTIALLLHEDVVLSTVSGALDMFYHTNRYFEANGKPPPFMVHLVGECATNTLLQFPDRYFHYQSLATATRPHLIIVPAWYGQPAETLSKHARLPAWIQEQFRNGSEVASLCSGSYFLAEAGILDGKPCTSHWYDMPDLQQRYPRVDFLANRVITDHDGVYTSGGAFSSLNLVLYLIEKFCGRETGIWASKMFSLDIDRVQQSHFAIFNGQHAHKDEMILKAQAFIEASYNEPLSVEQLAEHTHMSKRNFIRRFKSATQNTPLEYLQRVKIESAKKALEKSEENITTLMYDAGYNDVKTFRNVFKKFTGLTPQDYRRKYRRMA